MGWIGYDLIINGFKSKFKDKSMDKEKLKTFIHILAEESAQVMRPYFAQPDLKVESKPDATPVTLADREAETRLRDLIHRYYPEHGIIGEEFGSESVDAEFVWVLDPIDGTQSFISGVPLFGTLMGLMREGKPFLGAIHQPILNQLCIGDNQTTTLNGRAIHVRNTRRLDQATLLTTDTNNIALYQNAARWDQLVGSTRILRTWGDCYGYLLVAGGWADIMVDPIMNPWDIIPIIPVIRGAGGVITDWKGGDAVRGKSAIATNASLYEKVMKILNPE